MVLSCLALCYAALFSVVLCCVASFCLALHCFDLLRLSSLVLSCLPPFLCVCVISFYIGRPPVSSLCQVKSVYGSEISVPIEVNLEVSVVSGLVCPCLVLCCLVIVLRLVLCCIF